jgi:ABC-type sugar transport system ATPase subunit
VTEDATGPPELGGDDGGGTPPAPTAFGAHAAEAVGTRREPFVVINGLVKRYPGVVALDHASGVIVPGAIVGLLGKNGAGKSTLIKILAGVVQPDEGELVIDGEPVRLHGPLDATRRGFAFVHQELADVPNLTVAENIELGLGYPKFAGAFVRRRALRRKAAAVLERLGTDIDPESRIGALSIAERRLVVIARGLATNARLLVLDEPTASLTDEEIGHLHDVLRSLRDDGVAVLYVTHRLQEVYDLTDDIAVMRDGKMVFEAPTAAVERSELIEHITGHTAAVAADRWQPPEGDTPREELLRVEHVGRPGVVEDASFTVRAGDVLGIAGLVGAGRTELVRMIFGADRAATGQITVQGRPVRIRGPRDAMNAGIVLLPEDRRHQGTVHSFSVRKNITLPVLHHFRLGLSLPLPNRARERRASLDLIERLQIKVSDPESPIGTLSGGNQQKVVLAKWLESGANILIFDEPTHGIDVGAKEEVYQLMVDLAASGKGVIFISSEFPELVGICNRVIVMREGRLVGEFEGVEITETALVESCYTA